MIIHPLGERRLVYIDGVRGWRCNGWYIGSMVVNELIESGGRNEEVVKDIEKIFDKGAGFIYLVERYTASELIYGILTGELDKVYILINIVEEYLSYVADRTII